MIGGSDGQPVRLYLLAVVAVFWVWLVTDSGMILSVDKRAVAAARIFSDAVERVLAERSRSGIPVDPETDIHETGLIGERYTLLTSTVGSLPAKRSGTTPDAAAVMVHLIREAVDLDTVRGRGKIVAINCSGSFPGFCLAALAACSALELEAVATLSIGSSSWGANRVDFLLTDIVASAVQTVTTEGGSLPGYGHTPDGPITLRDVLLVTPGGHEDRGTDLDPLALKEALLRAADKGFSVYVPENLEDGISRREALYGSAGEVALFLTIGGNAVATGGNADVAMWHGIVMPGDEARAGTIADGGRDGLVLRYLRRGVPVVQVLNVKQLYSDWGVEYDPVRSPAIGDGRLYRHVPRGILRILLLVPVLVVLAYVGMIIRSCRMKSGSDSLHR
jgi:hypothetical protein